ncbi:MAG: hypothetical protein ACXWQE_13390 [Bdellovibrionales bacterium]
MRYLILTLGLVVAPLAAHSSSCNINVASKCNNPAVPVNSWFQDNYNNAASNQLACMQRAADYQAYCGTSSAWALFTSNANVTSWVLVTNGRYQMFSLPVGTGVPLGNLYSNPSGALVMQGDGNLVLYNNGTALWATSFMPNFDYGSFSGGTSGMNCSGCSAQLQSDGNLVLYAPNGPYWASRSSGQGATLTLSATRPFAFVDSQSGSALWSSSMMWTGVDLRDYELVEMNGWVLKNPASTPTVVEFSDMYQDPTYRTWIWADSLNNNGTVSLAVDYISSAYSGMVGVQRALLAGGNGMLTGFANPGSLPGLVGAMFPPNTMPLQMYLPVILPGQINPSGVTSQALQAFPWEQVDVFQMNPANCASQKTGTEFIRNSVYLVANYPFGGDIGTPDLTLFLETEMTDNPNSPLIAKRLERYAFVPGFGRVMMETVYDLRSPSSNQTFTTYTLKVPNPSGHFIGPLCPTNP